MILTSVKSNKEFGSVIISKKILKDLFYEAQNLDS
jgi:hypothetical protein